jgi:hypothetical protein
VTDGNRQLIDDLVRDLTPVRRPGRVARPTAFWLLAATVYGVVIILATGPLRPGALGALATHLSYIAETALAVFAIVTLATVTLRSAIPGSVRALRWLLALVPLVVWVAIYVFELRYPPVYYSSLGGRYECFWQVVLFSLPALGLMLYGARRLFPLRPRVTGFLAGAAAAAIPGELMQFGCMYVPEHILTHHLFPIAVTAVIGALLGPLVLKRHGDGRPRRAAPLH